MIIKKSIDGLLFYVRIRQAFIVSFACSWGHFNWQARSRTTKRKGEEKMTEQEIQVGLYNGKIVSVVNQWMDAKREIYYSVRMPDGSINSRVHYNEISFDRAEIRSRLH